MKKISLRWQVVFQFIFFSLVIYLVFWFTQVLSLNFFYRTVRVKSANELGEHLAEVVKNIDVTKKNYFFELDDTMKKRIQASESDAWVLYFDEFKKDVSVAYSNIFTLDVSKETKDLFYTRINTLGAYENKTKNSYTYCETIKDYNGLNVIVLVYTTFAPFNASKMVFSNQFFLISVVIFILGVAFALMMHHQIVKPIASLTKSAKQLAKGNFKVKFDADEFIEIEELSDALNYASTELSKLDHYQKELMSNVSHDLRTPLTLIAGYSEMMRDFPNERTEENLQIIVDETKRLTGLVNDILSLSKLQIGSESLIKEDYSLTDSIKEIVYRQEKLVENLGIKISFEYDENVCIEADSEQMSKVIYNYITNAINYVGDDKEVIVKQIVTNDVVQISVIDHGVGISEKEVANIWDRYYKAKNHIRAQVGSGLGLSIVKGVLENHGFEYGVNSKVGEGSEFWFKCKIKK